MTETDIEITPQYDLSTVVIPLLKGVIYQEGDVGLWSALLNLQVRVRDYVEVLGLELVLDEAEGYAFLRSRQAVDDDEDAAPQLPQLIIARRPMSFPVSLLLALADVRVELEKRWQRGQLLAKTLTDSGLFPLRIVLKQPSTSQLSDDFAAARFFQIEWRDINHRRLGRNQLLAAALDTAKTGAACREAER